MPTGLAVGSRRTALPRYPRPATTTASRRRRPRFHRISRRNSPGSFLSRAVARASLLRVGPQRAPRSLPPRSCFFPAYGGKGRTAPGRSRREAARPGRVGTRRRGWDSNPRGGVTRPRDFQSRTLSRSVTSPGASKIATAEGDARAQARDSRLGTVGQRAQNWTSSGSGLRPVPAPRAAAPGLPACRPRRTPGP